MGRRTLVVHRRPPDTAGPDPRDRQVARTVDVLAAVRGDRVDVVAAESDHGVAIAGGPLSGAVRASLSSEVGLVVATGVVEGQVAVDAAGSCPTVLDLIGLPSLASGDSLAPEHRGLADGQEALVAEAEAVETELLARVAGVVARGPDVAEAVARLSPSTPCTVAWPPVTTPRFVPDHASRRPRVGRVARWTSEPGSPDEDALVWLDHTFVPRLERRLGPVVDFVECALDTPRPDLRHVASRSSFAAGPWEEAVGLARVVVAFRRHGPAPAAVIAEVMAWGAPVLVAPAHSAWVPDGLACPESDLAARAERLIVDPGAWAEAAAAVAALVRSRHAQPGEAAAWARLLDEVGVNSAGRTLDEAASPRPRVAAAEAGSLGRPIDAAQAIESTMGGGFTVDRMDALDLQMTVPPHERYRMWRAVHAEPPGPVPVDDDVERTISVLLPVHDTPPDLLRAAVESVCDQAHPRWELCVADDGSTDPDTLDALSAIGDADDRIRSTRIAAGGISGATNAALALATGEFVTFLDHDDVLDPNALGWVHAVLGRDPDLDVVYSDEDKIASDGRRVTPYFKPDWSPDLLLGLNYMTHLTVIRRSLVEDVGGLRPAFDGAQDFDLFLRVTERTDRIAHVPLPLYGWRQIEGSTSQSLEAKPEAHLRGRAALAESLRRRGIDADVVDGNIPTWHRVRRRVTEPPSISVVIPTRDRVDLLRRCIDEVRETTAHLDVEIVVVDNESSDPETLGHLTALDASQGATVVRYPHRFNYARQMNLGVVRARGDLVLMLNNDATPRVDDWLDSMVEHAVRPEVGAVGARLLWPDGRAQHEGIVLDVGGVAYNLSSGDQEVWGRAVRNCAAVTGACLLTRRSTYWSVGGFDESLRVAFNDVDFCLRIGQAGYRIVYTPFAELEHAESSTRRSLHPFDDEERFVRRWGQPGTVRDPFYGRHLDLLDPLVLRT